MKTHRKKRLGLIALMAAMIATAISLTLWALRQNINLYLTPSEVVSHAPLNQRVRVGGLVQQGSVQHDPVDLKVSFVLTDLTNTVLVHYQGVLPDLFREKQGIVVEGQLDEHEVLQATRVLAKHDENYKPPAGLNRGTT